MLNKNKLILLLSFYLIFFFNTAPHAAKAEKISPNDTYKDNQILVKFKKDPDKIYDSFLNNFAKSYNLTCQSSENAVENSKKGYFLFTSSDNMSVWEKIKNIKKDSRVKKAQPNFIFSPAFTKVSAGKAVKKNKSSQDKYFNREWWIFNNGTLGTAGSDIYLLNIWNQEQKTWPGVIIGLIDTGLNQKHNDLKNNIVNGYDFVHNKSKKMTDKDGHGSFIAGLIASKVSNKKGIAGLSRTNRLKVMPLKFDFSTDQAISAIAFAQARGVRILNTSWGTEEYDTALYEAIRTYQGIVVAAAGNESSEHNETTHFYPCDFDLSNIICVGASNEHDELAYYSDWGSTVDILAPGGTEGAPLISLDLKANRYIDGIGSSYATALVSGAAGLVLSANPSISNEEIKNLILKNARLKEELTGKIVTGGILNIKGAVNREIQ